MSGITLPSNNFSSAITDAFPNVNRTYKVESGIASRYLRDYLPLNSNISNGKVNDSYIEFLLTGNAQEFIDLNSFAVEFKIKNKKMMEHR